VPANSFVPWVVRQRDLAIEEFEQFPSAGVIQIVLVIVGTFTERAVIVLKPFGSFRVDMLHGVKRPAVSRIRLNRHNAAIGAS
jgi:hypothetical protein